MDPDSESKVDKAGEESDPEEYEYSYNFINKPWDERSKKSKIGITSLLVAVFVSIMGLVINNLVLHFKGFDARSIYSYIEIDCNVVKVDKYPYAARIHSISSNELICIGAVVTASSVLANELCLKSGPIRLRVGSPTDPRCKKGFIVDVVDVIPHEGVITKSLVLLTTLETMEDCIESIKIGFNLDFTSQLSIIGRPYRGGRALSLQLSRYTVENNTTLEILRSINKNKTICVQTIGKCPVRVGDLLIQKGKLLGLASTSIHRREKRNTACFANLSVVYTELMALGVDVRNPNV